MTQSGDSDELCPWTHILLIVRLIRYHSTSTGNWAPLSWHVGRTTLMSSIGSMGTKHAPDFLLVLPPAVKHKVSPCVPVVLGKVEKTVPPSLVSSTRKFPLFWSRMTSMSSVGSMGMKHALDCLLLLPPAVKRKVSPCVPVVMLQFGVVDQAIFVVLESHDLNVICWIHGHEACTRLLTASPTSG
ncbi:uncharacterized protein F5147DRAFT_658058 [Suillus discolor]|uniref:Uncharacterized protein n=1 Tax=Suillus discolor TaxID=1912936 RepID=A0A9P7EVR3_9AGAM|nr:uncharacterized protein F5147DRAFT_658058 [Suillus discolor]KAG2090916.1 hypothetical protein F5147DRAFT_658058 [Suillus discolor]